MKNTAIILAAGSGKRMNSNVKKQYIEILGRPLLWYTLNAFEKSELIQEIILVTSGEDMGYCRKNLVENYGFSKVRGIVCGGRERYHSVREGILAIEKGGGCDYVFVQDGARPFVSEEMLLRLFNDVTECNACVAAVKAKDTIKISDEEDYVSSTPNRNLTWIIQTPQVFGYELIKEAYNKLSLAELENKPGNIVVTDDSMVVETWTDHKVKLTEGSYENIKITTPEDLILAEALAGKYLE